METGSSTIFALSSGRPPAAIAVVRISGPRAGDALKILTGRIPPPRQAALARVRDAAGGPIDEAVALWFPAPHSETGEDVAELQLHGSRAVLAAVFDTLRRVPGLRPAEAGEFTRRAFENGKLDLTEVEGLADLIAAETDAQRRQAFRQMKGLLGERAETWRRQLIEARAMVEAPIDFSDEGDVPQSTVDRVLAIVRDVSRDMTAALDTGGRGERLREGLVVAIAGPPNAGKSTLLNRIAGREVAIVSPHAGTTRDVIEAHLDLGGFPVTLLDTAGIRESTDPVEAEGIRRARQRAGEADLVLWMVDAAAVTPSRKPATIGAKMADSTPFWVVFSKIDAVSARNEVEFANEQEFINEYIFNSYDMRDVSRETIFAVSATTGAGLNRLIGRLQEFAGQYFGASEPALITRERHRHVLHSAVDALKRTEGLADQDSSELIAEELRIASDALGRLTGRIDVEDILDVVFREFCIGK